tara:strand:- start:5626 stop:7119 length:1494 start_codon:yes stop_codon:yes gene_type:complete
MSKVNDYFRQKLLRIGEENRSTLFPLVKRAVYLTDLGVSSDEDLERYLFLQKEANKLKISISKKFAKEIIKKAVDNGDVLYYIMERQISDSSIKKIAYPNPGLSPDSLSKEIDLNNWLNIVHKIYKDCQKGIRTKESAVKFYSNILDNEEKQKFLRWFEYYSNGDHLKYSEYKEEKMKKESLFQSGLVGTGPYTQDNPGYNFSGRNRGNNMPGDSFTANSLSEGKKKDSFTNKERLIGWKKSINRACKRIDTLLRDGDIPYDEYSEMAKHLFELSSLIKRIKLASTMSDVTHRTANMLKKAGHDDHANALVKIAQEIAEEQIAPPTEAPPSEVTQSNPPEDQGPAGPSAQEQKSGVEIPEPDEVEPTKLRDIEPVPGPREGEYEILAGDINLEDAAKKLDEVAGMLADRRIIRKLAEFDIMLDKIGIASMFPELAESQSKLIDAFSYALTRVTKMMGQLSNAKTLLEAGGPIPGTDLPEAPPSEAPTEPVESEELPG